MMENVFHQLTSFFDHPLFIIIGGLTVVFSIIGILYRVIFWLFGITPFVLRLGVALWKREIAVFANSENFNSLKTLLVDSGLFKSSNITHIGTENIDKAKGKTIFLVDWESFSDQIDLVFSARANHQVALVIFAKPASIPQEKMASIANSTNTVVVNFRGRLLNDILTSLMTTSYEKK